MYKKKPCLRTVQRHLALWAHQPPLDRAAISRLNLALAGVAVEANKVLLLGRGHLTFDEFHSLINIWDLLRLYLRFENGILFP